MTAAIISAEHSTRPANAISMQVYALKVTLLGIEPPVWRRLLVEREITLGQLHKTLQIVMGWTNSHLHQFILQKQKRTDGTKLGDLIGKPGARLLYEYDFGDCWQHELLLEEILVGDESFQRMCVAGARSCPPEDCGGPGGYADLVSAIADSSHPDHDFVCEWLCEEFDPEQFSADEVNRRLRPRKQSRRRRPSSKN